MKRCFAVLFLLALFSTHSFASECDSDVQTLGYLYELREMLLEGDASPWEIDERIDEIIHDLRGPLPEGGYQWVELARPAENGPIDRTEHFVQSIAESSDHESFSASASVPFAVSLVVPRKRNLFRGNHRVWIGSVKLRTWIEGELEESEEVLDQWMSPSSSRRFDFEAIADRGEVVLEVATDPGFEDAALIEVHFEQAVPQDRPDNPSFATIQTLNRLNDRIDPETIDREIRRIEESFAPGIDAIPVTQLVLWIREYDELRDSDDADDQKKAEELLARIRRILPR